MSMSFTKLNEYISGKHKFERRRLQTVLFVMPQLHHAILQLSYTLISVCYKCFYLQTKKCASSLNALVHGLTVSFF